MQRRSLHFAKREVLWLASCICFALLFVAVFLADTRSAAALPLPSANIRAIPAFARKYGMPCSACHLAWPALSPFGQAFKDNGYQLGNDRDAPIFQNPAYWPMTLRITPFWHRESTDHLAVDNPAVPGGTMESQITTSGFDWSGLDILSGGTLAKNISFLVTPSSDNTGAFHIESVWGRLDNVLGTSWVNIKLGKFELDNLLSEKRILTLSANGGLYQNYHFQPIVSPGAGKESLYTFGLGDNQVGLELLGHSKDDRTRYSVSLLSANDGQPGLPTSRDYDTFVTASQAFQVGSLGLWRVGGFGFWGTAPTFFEFTQTPAGGTPTGVPGVGIGNKSFYRVGFVGQFYVKKLDFQPLYFHGWDSAFLGTNTPSNTPLPAGAQAPTWNGFLLETHYTWNPQLIFINRYEAIRMSRQPFVTNPSDLSNIDSLVFGYRFYPFISSRAGFAFHNEYAIVRQRGAAVLTGRDLTSSSVFLGFDLDF
jgi:hypothetical protein